MTRFQQTSPPVTAKGVEDTAFYRYNRAAGAQRGRRRPRPLRDRRRRRSTPPTLQRAERFPRGLLVTQTHDTKRGGDVRARIGALAGMAGEWREHVLRWREVNAELRADGAPDANEEYLIYQTLVGAWPIEPERLEAYLEKALREAKRNTSWVEQDHDWERRVQRFAVALLDHRPFLDSFEPVRRARGRGRARAARSASSSSSSPSPGVPDVYQGDELEALNLVDPDNRRPVDWEARRRALDALRDGAAATPETAKLRLIWRALDLRARRPEAFDGGAYTPLEAGPDVVAFRRADDVLAVVAIRDPGEATLAAPGRWRDVLTGAERELGPETAVAELVDGDGLALLERAD